MNNELAKKLKDAGFPIGKSNNFYTLPSNNSRNDELIYIPTLSELIEACGDRFAELRYWPGSKDWRALSQAPDLKTASEQGNGKFPDEAVAYLYLALNTK